MRHRTARCPTLLAPRLQNMPGARLLAQPWPSVSHDGDVHAPTFALTLCVTGKTFQITETPGCPSERHPGPAPALPTYYPDRGIDLKHSLPCVPQERSGGAEGSSALGHPMAACPLRGPRLVPIGCGEPGRPSMLPGGPGPCAPLRNVLGAAPTWEKLSCLSPHSCPRRSAPAAVAGPRDPRARLGGHGPRVAAGHPDEAVPSGGGGWVSAPWGTRSRNAPIRCGPH